MVNSVRVDDWLAAIVASNALVNNTVVEGRTFVLFTGTFLNSRKITSGSQSPMNC